MNVIIITSADNAWHNDFVAVYVSLEAAARDLGVTWERVDSPGYKDVLPPSVYWRGMDENHVKYHAEQEDVLA